MLVIQSEAMGRIRQQAIANQLSECGPSSPAGLPVEPVQAAGSRSERACDSGIGIVGFADIRFARDTLLRFFDFA